MPAKLEYSKFRMAMLEVIRAEILGPVEDNERILHEPRRRYVVGQLSPTKSIDRLESTLEPEMERAEINPKFGGEAEVQISGQADADVPHRTAVSSIGLTFVCGFGTRLVVDISWGEYCLIQEAETEESTSNLKVDRSSLPDEGRQLQTGVWERTPIKHRAELPVIGEAPLSKRFPLSPRASLHLESRSEGRYAVVSLFLINDSRDCKKGVDERLYQPKIFVGPVDLSARPFLSRDLVERNNPHAQENDEELGLALLYRERKEFAVGRHVAAEATDISSDGLQARYVETEVIPHFELPTTAARKALGTGGSLQQAWIADCTDAVELARELDSAFDGYDSWIRSKNEEVACLPEHLRDVATSRLAECGSRFERIRAGIDVLRTNRDAFEAFRVVNEAMARVRFRQGLMKPDSIRDDASFDQAGRAGSWYPFQLAFVLSVLPELTSPEEPNLAEFRKTVDVLFFPTGGGKTEAYLGAMAFCALLRRRRGNGAGVSAILRYTYRLLSTQQFARAATLICALESIRLEARTKSDGTHSWMSDVAPFSIGLWIGSAQTPNSYKKAKNGIEDHRYRHTSCTKVACSLAQEERLDRASVRNPRDRNETFSELSSPLVLPFCPWCGSQLCIDDVHANDSTERTTFVCPDERCLFSAERSDRESTFDKRIGLPIATVDEEIFKGCPTIIVGTADKFATLWYRPEARALFGKVSAYCERHGYLTPGDGTHRHPGGQSASAIKDLPPIDLFVQDELHLINEALGSAYGFLECAVDELSRRGELVPKKIGATATIRRSQEQVRLLYDRPSRIFPLAPIDAGDSFFASEKEPSADAPGRLYVGLYAPSQSRLYALDQIIAAQMDAAYRLIEEFDAETADPYRTLVIYCNTLRDLGQIQGLLVDDIPTHLRTIAGLRSGDVRELRDVKSELTSKTPQVELRETMRKIASTFAQEEAEGRYGCDVVCATSMLSVGIDIDRLGAILVDGQPKSTAEYIQATSRIGRSFPGIVLTSYNAQRPRDLSHYEHFYSYHNALYKYVETPSVTPTSFGTIEKYLENVFIAIYRLDSGYRSDDAARPFTEHSIGVREACDALLLRVNNVGSEFEQTYLSENLKTMVDTWVRAAQNVSLKYDYPLSVFNQSQAEASRQSMYVVRMDQPDDKPENVLFEAPMSLRNVEDELTMVLGS